MRLTRRSRALLAASFFSRTRGCRPGRCSAWGSRARNSRPRIQRVVTAIVMTPTAVAVGRAAIVAVAVTRPVTWGDVHHRLVRRRSVNHARRAIRHHRRAVNDGRQTTRCSDHDGRREDDRRPEGDAHRPTRLRRGGEPSDRNHCYQTEEMFCSHARFDGVFRRFFKGSKKRHSTGLESVSEQRMDNE